MEGSSNQTSAYITPTHTYIPSANITENNTYFKNDTSTQDMYEHERYRLILITLCLVFCVAFPGICLSVYGLYALLKKGQFLPVYVMNLFISDIIQTAVNLVQISILLLCLKKGECYDMLFNAFTLIYTTGVLVNICFMVCVSAERYIMIVRPVWYRNINTIKTSVCVSVTVWIITVAIITITRIYCYSYLKIFVLLFMLLPYPLVIFFLVGTWRALSRNVSIPHHDQRRIIGILALVLCIYTVLFLPYTVVLINEYTDFVNTRDWIYLGFSAEILIAMNPLFDFLLYLFMRRDAKQILKALFFWCRKRHKQNRSTETVTIQVLT